MRRPTSEAQTIMRGSSIGGIEPSILAATTTPRWKRAVYLHRAAGAVPGSKLAQIAGIIAPFPSTQVLFSADIPADLRLFARSQPLPARSPRIPRSPAFIRGLTRPNEIRVHRVHPWLILSLTRRTLE